MDTNRHPNTGADKALTEILGAIHRDSDTEVGVISIALDQSKEFQAQQLPLLLVPRGAVFLQLSSASRRTKNWQGHFVVFSDDQVSLKKATETLAAGNNARPIKRGENYIVLGPSSS